MIMNEQTEQVRKTREFSSICVAVDNYMITIHIGPPFPAYTDLIKLHYGKFSDVYMHVYVLAFMHGCMLSMV